MLPTKAQLDALDAAAASWIGTPFCEGSPMKGVAVSCHHLVAELFFESCLIERFPVPNGPSKWSPANSRSLIVEWVEQSGLFVRIGDGFEWRALARLAQPADLLGFRVVNAIHHAATLLRSGRMAHSVIGHGATIAPCIPVEWGRRLEAVWRLKQFA